MKLLVFLLLSVNLLTGKTIIGTVYDSYTNEPIPNVKIIIDINVLEISTDNHGVFELEVGKKTHADFIKSGYLEKHLNLNENYDSISVFLTPLSYDYEDVTVIDSKRQKTTTQSINQSTINESNSKSLSKILSSQLGISSSEMGEAVSRPVLNGLSGNRLAIVNDGFKSKDLSSNSPDHAQAQTLNGLDRISILTGTDLVRFGSSLVGSAVYTESNYNIKSTISDNSHLISNTFASVNNKYSISTQNQINHILNGFVLNGVYTETGDVSSPKGILRNTYYSLYEVSSGLFYEIDEFSINPYLSVFEKEYGIPGGFVGAHPNGVDIKMQRNTIGFNSSYHTHGAVIDKVNLDYERSFYDHKEFENSGLIGAQFRFVSNSVRLELEQHQGSFLKNGYFGLQLTRKENQLGGFVFIPNNQYDVISGYLNEEVFLLESLNLELGSRFERINVDLNSPYEFQNRIITERNFTSLSNAISLNFNANEELQFTFDFASSNRAPEPEELFSDGPHLAAYSYEVGNPDLDLEKSISYSLKSKYKSERFTLSSEVYYYDYSNYITPMATGDTNFSTLLPIFKQTNLAANLYGININTELSLLEDMSMYSNLHYTVGREKVSGNYLPLIPPITLNLGVNYKIGNWFFDLNSNMATSQENLGQFESRTDGYIILNTEIKRNIDLDGNLLAVIINVNNFTNQIYRNHLSRIKSVYLQPGISTELIVNYYF